MDNLDHRPGEAGGTVLLLPVQYCTHLISRYLGLDKGNFHQIPIGNLHLVSTMAVLLSYFSRRPLLMRVVGVVVTTGTLARYLHIHNNIYDNIYNIIYHTASPWAAWWQEPGVTAGPWRGPPCSPSPPVCTPGAGISTYLHIYIYISTYLPHDSHVTLA